MKNIFLLRHANALSPQGNMKDRERPLSQKGWQELDLLRPQIQNILPTIELVLCSNAKRTRQTLDHFQSLLNKKTQVLYVDGLYEIQLGSLMEKLKTLNDSIQSVLVVGHNPSLTQFTHFSLQNKSAATQTYFEVGTGAFVCLEAEIDRWRSLKGPVLKYKKHYDPSNL